MPAKRSRSRALPLVLAVAAGLLLAAPAAGALAGTDARLEKAVEHRAEVQRRLDEVLQLLAALEAEIDDLEARLAGLAERERVQRERAGEATGQLATQLRQSYIRGTVDPTLTLLTSGTVPEAQEQARLLGLLAVRNRQRIERASAERVRVAAAAEEVTRLTEAVRGRRAEMDERRAEVAALLAEAEAEEHDVREQIAAEERARAERERRRRERQQRALAQRAARSGAQAQPASVSGGIACPVGQPRSYSDTWGAPRSGGRWHKGTDILAPRGTPIYAYESGTISRLSSNSLGGISLYLRGDSGNQYYYTHLQGYVAGLSTGSRVGAGQHIALNGDTGNARGIPHLHFEVRPGGGSNVNPYPYVRNACG